MAGWSETQRQRQARQAVGGAAGQVRPHFRAYQTLGRLLSPQQAAAALIRAPMGDTRLLHGRTVTPEDFPPRPGDETD